MRVFYTKLVEFFSTPSAETIALRELEDAKRQLLMAYSYREEGDAAIRKYNERIQRLNKYLHTVTTETP
jgi:hypothetical protein